MTEMTIEEAKAQLSECQAYIGEEMTHYAIGSPELVLDGGFTLEDLKAIVTLIEAGEIK